MVEGCRYEGEGATLAAAFREQTVLIDLLTRAHKVDGPYGIRKGSSIIIGFLGFESAYAPVVLLARLAVEGLIAVAKEELHPLGVVGRARIPDLAAIAHICYDGLIFSFLHRLNEDSADLFASERGHVHAVGPADVVGTLLDEGELIFRSGCFELGQSLEPELVEVRLLVLRGFYLLWLAAYVCAGKFLSCSVLVNKLKDSTVEARLEIKSLF